MGRLAEQRKTEGTAEYSKKNYLKAIDLYTEAIGTRLLIPAEPAANRADPVHRAEPVGAGLL